MRLFRQSEKSPICRHISDWLIFALNSSPVETSFFLGAGEQSAENGLSVGSTAARGGAERSGEDRSAERSLLAGGLRDAAVFVSAPPTS